MQVGYPELGIMVCCKKSQVDSALVAQMKGLINGIPQWEDCALEYLLSVDDSLCLVAIDDRGQLQGFIIAIQEDGSRVQKVIRVGVRGLDLQVEPPSWKPEVVLNRLFRKLRDVSSAGSNMVVIASLDYSGLRDVLFKLRFRCLRILKGPAGGYDYINLPVAGIYTRRR